MSTDRDVTRIVRSWLHEDAHEDADRVLDMVVNLVDTTPQRRPSWLARRTPTMNSYARLGLVAAAVLAVVIVGIGLLGRSPDVGPATSSSPVPSPSVTASPAVAVNPFVGTWLAPAVTCAQQTAAVAAAFTPEQMALAWSCTDVSPVQYSLVFDARRPEDGTYHLRQHADGLTGWDGVYHLVDESTFQAGDLENYYITYHFAIDGDQLTIDMISDDFARADYGSATPSEAELLGEQMIQTAIYETSPFTRQP
jgi:hypothetical protein